MTHSCDPQSASLPPPAGMERRMSRTTARRATIEVRRGSEASRSSVHRFDRFRRSSRRRSPQDRVLPRDLRPDQSAHTPIACRPGGCSPDGVSFRPPRELDQVRSIGSHRVQLAGSSGKMTDEKTTLSRTRAAGVACRALRSNAGQDDQAARPITSATMIVARRRGEVWLPRSASEMRLPPWPVPPHRSGGDTRSNPRSRSSRSRMVFSQQFPEALPSSIQVHTNRSRRRPDDLGRLPRVSSPHSGGARWTRAAWTRVSRAPERGRPCRRDRGAEVRGRPSSASRASDRHARC